MLDTSLTGTIVAVCRNASPGLPKPVVDAIHLIEDWGVEGDYHAGKFVRHRYLARKDPRRPNMRQVLLADTQTIADLAQDAIHIGPGMLGENIMISGLTLIQFPIGTHITIGAALLEITEVRIPCKQLNSIDARLLQAVTTQHNGEKAFKAGIMVRVLQGGWARAGDRVTVQSTR